MLRIWHVTWRAKFVTNNLKQTSTKASSSKVDLGTVHAPNPSLWPKNFLA